MSLGMAICDWNSFCFANLPVSVYHSCSDDSWCSSVCPKVVYGGVPGSPKNCQAQTVAPGKNLGPRGQGAKGPRGQGVKGPRGQGAKGPRGQSKETVSDHLLFVDGFASDLWFICRILLDTYSEPWQLRGVPLLSTTVNWIIMCIKLYTYANWFAYYTRLYIYIISNVTKSYPHMFVDTLTQRHSRWRPEAGRAGCAHGAGHRSGPDWWGQNTLSFRCGT